MKLLLDVRDIFKCHAFHQTCVQNDKKQRFIFIVVKDIYVSAHLTVEVIWLCNLSILSIPHEGYSRNSSWTVNLISTFLLLLFTIVIYVDQIERTPSQIVAQHSLTRQDHLSCVIRSILCFTNCNLWKSAMQNQRNSNWYWFPYYLFIITGLDLSPFIYVYIIIFMIEM